MLPIVPEECLLNYVQGVLRCQGEQLATLRFNAQTFGFACLHHALEEDLLTRLQA